MALALVWWSMGPSPALAQSVAELNREALEAYTNLDIQRAGSLLEQALRISYRSGAPGPMAARTHANLGVVLIGGLGENDAGLEQFLHALCIDSSIQLDPTFMTPDIQSVFNVARTRVAAGACGGAPPPPTQPVAPPPPDQAVSHHVPPEQLSQTPLPLYAEVSPAVKPKRMFLYYKAIGMNDYKRVPMYVYQQGFAYQISCNDVWAPHLSYYMEAHDADGDIVGIVGSAAQPIVVSVVAQRSEPAPALPGASPPQSCAGRECPPDVEGCVSPGAAAIGDACDEDTDCQPGLECSDDECMLIGARGIEGPDFDEGESWEDIEESDAADASGFQRAFVQLGLTLGAAYVQAGMPADRPSPDELVFVDEAGNYVFDPAARVLSQQPIRFPEPGGQFENRLTAWVPDADSFDSLPMPLEGHCEADGTPTGPQEFLDPANAQDLDTLYPSKYCVRVKEPGFVPLLALRGALGYFVTDALSVAAIWRFQFDSGQGTLASILLGGRVEYMLTPARSEGFMLSLFGGGTLGQIQTQPPANGNTVGAPYARSGLMGVHVGATARYRLHKNFGFYAAPEIDLQFPNMLFNVDFTVLGVEASFDPGF